MSGANGAPASGSGSGSFVRLYHSLVARTKQPGGLWVVVTSVRRGEGVTAVASGLARAMAADGDTVCWSMDARPGGAGGALQVIPCASGNGAASPGRLEVPAPLVEAGAASEAATAARLRERYRFGVIDAAPVLASSACLRLAGAVHGAVLVVEARSTSWRSAQEAVGVLESGGLAPLGLVLNKTRPELPSRWSRLFGETCE